ncbi:MBL fold metallo-hydrolase, partial [Stackebrandtia soli]|uniref:MBL fold metallo-hydrolase n=1 Tax=Stackebrandtia soli TaxID=1892856 RepID=UPI0039E981C8
MADEITIGRTRIIAIHDGEGPFFSPRDKAFPGSSAARWATADRLDPGAVTDDGRWWLRFRAFVVVEPDDTVTIVDAGIGPEGAPASWAPLPGRLPESLRNKGIDRDHVDRVIITHLHTDHVGWAVVEDAPFFPRAEYLLPRADADAVSELNPMLRERLLDVLDAAGVLRLVDGDQVLSPRVATRATPGHTPGHQSVIVRDGDGLLAITGDALLGALQLLYPEQPYEHEEDPALARESRTRLLGDVATMDGLLATPHMSMPFIAVPKDAASPSHSPSASPSHSRSD